MKIKYIMKSDSELVDRTMVEIRGRTEAEIDAVRAKLEAEAVRPIRLVRCQKSFGGYEDEDVGPEWDDTPQQPELITF